MTLFLGPGFRFWARWNRLGEAVKMHKKREFSGKKWARYGLKGVKGSGSPGDQARAVRLTLGVLVRREVEPSVGLRDPVAAQIEERQHPRGGDGCRKYPSNMPKYPSDFPKFQSEFRTSPIIGALGR